MDIVGHAKIIKFLDRSIKSENIANAYLFSGPEHLGKFTIALDFAKKITGDTKQKINPDIIIISPEMEEKKGITKKKDIKIEQIRELQKELSLSSYFGKYKVAIIDDAERLTISAQNALLKTLEDTPEKTVVILVVHNIQKILPTVRSRCLQRKFGLAKKEEISALIGEEKNQEEMIFWSLGKAGLALEMKNNSEKLSFGKEIKNDFLKIAGGNLNDRFALAESWSKNNEESLEKLNLWLVILRENILTGGKFLNMNSEKSLKIIEKTEETVKNIKETNANVRLALENLFLTF